MAYMQVERFSQALHMGSGRGCDLTAAGKE